MGTTYQEVNPSLIEHTTMVKVLFDGVHRKYRITQNEGYKLHVKGRDVNDIDPVTGEEIHELGYTSTTVSIDAAYDFETNPQEFYAVLKENTNEDTNIQ